MKTKNEIKAILKDLLVDKADFALLFGSLVKQAQFSSESDVDCGVFLHSEHVEDLSYFDIAEQFEHIVGRKLDLVCLNTADTYKANVMSRYVDFKQSRKTIEDNILVRPNYGK
jgi:predicted nucleotidyltransferase